VCKVYIKVFSFSTHKNNVIFESKPFAVFTGEAARGAMEIQRDIGKITLSSQSHEYSIFSRLVENRMCSPNSVSGFLKSMLLSA